MAGLKDVSKLLQRPLFIHDMNTGKMWVSFGKGSSFCQWYVPGTVID